MQISSTRPMAESRCWPVRQASNTIPVSLRLWPRSWGWLSMRSPSPAYGAIVWNTCTHTAMLCGPDA
eukprot:6329672-Prorocentrum_lima.AAC.1